MPRTKRNPRLELPPLELDCMKALWALGEGSVHRVRERLLSARPLAYTTVMTILGRLAQKGAAERFKRSRSYYYRPAVSQDQVRRQAVQRLLAEHFEGSQSALLAFVNSKAEPPAERPLVPERNERPEAARLNPRPSERENQAESVIDEALL